MANQTPTPYDSPARSGFALVISLVMMGFILLLLLSITVFVRVESNISEFYAQKLRAKENALLGLNIALGNLQKAAGADRIATGSLDVDSSLNVDPSKAHWTGAWANSGAYDARRNLASYEPELSEILVSGREVASDLQTASDDAWPLLVGGDSVSDPLQKVRAPAVDIESDVSTGTGRYAFWVGDEGTKATVTVHDALSDTPEDLRRLLLMPRTGSEMMRADYSSDAAEVDLLGDAFPGDPSTLNKIHTADAIDLAVTGGKRFRKANFHDLTVHAKGILTDQRTGGLRRDLSWMLSNDALPEEYLYEEPVSLLNRSFVPGPAWSLLQDFYQQSVELSQTGRLSAQPTVRQIGDPADHRNSISPVLSQLKLYFNFSLGSPTPAEDGGHLRMHLFPVVVLHNPYNVPLAPDDYSFQFEQHNTQDSTELLVRVDTDDGEFTEFGGYKFKDGINALFDPRPRSGRNDRSGSIFFHAEDLGFAPGEVKILTLEETDNYLGPLNPDLTTFNADDPEGNRLAEGFDGSKSAVIEFEDALPEGKSPTFYEFELVNSGVLRFQIRLESSQDDFFQNKYDGVAYSASSPTSATAEQGDNLVIFPKAGFSYTIDTNGIRYLANFNPRGSLVSLNGYVTDRTIPPRLYTGDYGLGDFSTDHQSGTGNGYFGSGHSSDDQRSVTLFDIPENPSEFVSLGQLRHIDFSVKTINPVLDNDHSDFMAPAYILGNSEGDPNVLRGQTYYDDSMSRWWEIKAHFDESYRTNEALWDGFYFSTMFGDTSGGSTAEPPENPRLLLGTTADAIESSPFGAAKHLMIEGAFNVNATSVEAWKGLLSGLNTHDLERLDGSQQNDQSLLFPRILRPIGDASTKDQLGPEDPNLWHGVRSLTEDEVTELAEAIVAEVRARGPFLSLAHFINRDLDAEEDEVLSGAMHAAMQATDLNATLNGPAVTSAPAGTDYPEPDFFEGHAFDSAPSAINQADLLTPLAPLLAARSDTFRIRAYGEAGVGVDNQTPARVWVEAIVQRYPEKLEADEPIETAATADTFGRKFHVLSMRWLPPQQ